MSEKAPSAAQSLEQARAAAEAYRQTFITESQIERISSRLDAPVIGIRSATDSEEPAVDTAVKPDRSVDDAPPVLER
ncbi:MAG: hypothetical protein AAFQ47_07900 [Pseudomonadota bacterium]